jgi:hypothetical protein
MSSPSMTDEGTASPGITAHTPLTTIHTPLTTTHLEGRHELAERDRTGDGFTRGAEVGAEHVHELAGGGVGNVAVPLAWGHAQRTQHQLRLQLHLQRELTSARGELWSMVCEL